MYASSAGAAAREGRVPVFHESKDLTVTAVQIVRGGSVYPIGAVTSAEIVKRPTQRLIDAVKITAASIVLCAIFPAVRDFLILLGYGWVAWVFLLFGISFTLLGVLAAAESILQHGLRVSFSSGDSFTLWTFDVRAVSAMHAAVGTATANHTQRLGQPVSVATELSRLVAMRDQGAISVHEWERARDLFLGKQPDAQQQSLSQLQYLHELFRSGVLTESEFNMKKWDILASSARA